MKPNSSYNGRMKKAIIIAGIAIAIFSFPLSVFSQTEVTYPSLPGIGIPTPQEAVREAGFEEDVFPVFMAYLFNLLLMAALLTTVGVVIYGGVLYAFSGENPEKKKEARRWIISAFQGAFIVLFSHTFLYALDTGFVVFRARELAETRRIERVDLEWTIKDIYFQVPLGLLIEDAGLNENARDKFYDILDATDEAESQADAVVQGGEQLLEIIEECPEGMTCDCDEPFFYPYPIPYSPHFPHPRPQGGLISPPNLERAFSMERPSGLQIKIKQRSLKEAERELERISDEEIRKEFKEFFEKVERLIQQRASTEDFRDARREMESLLSSREKEIEGLRKRKREAIEDVLHALPLADTGYGGTTYYAQFDPQWGDMLYGTHTFRDSACYGASVAMVIDTLLDREVDPVDIRNISRPFIVNGSIHGIVPNAANYYGLSYQRFETMEQVLSALDKGRMVVMTGGGMPHNMSRAGGHAYVLSGIDREKGVVYRSDPGHAYLETLPIHEIKRSNPNFAHTIYKGGGAERIGDFLASVFNNLKMETVLPKGEVPVSLLSFFRDDIQTAVAGDCCPDCPEISPAIQEKLAEINYFLALFRNSLLRMIDTKYPLEQDIYHLYKGVMVKSLGSESVIPYTTLLLNRRHHEREEVYFETYEETQEVASHYRSHWYFWNWRQWLENITYKVRVGGEIRKENDPVSFYLERPRNDDTISEAKELARRENWQSRRAIPPYLWWYLDRTPDNPPIVCAECVYKRNIPPYLWWYIVERPMSIGPDEGRYPPCPGGPIAIDSEDPLYLARQIIKEELERLPPEEVALASTENLPEDLTPEEFEEMMEEEEEEAMLRETGAPGDYLTCGMEIPVGETVELVRNHLQKTLRAIDDYLVEGVCFIELQEIMNRLAAGCSCPCTTCTSCDDPDEDCGQCILTCDKDEIYRAYQDVLESRERLKEKRNRIAQLTAGYFESPTENLCHNLNQDVREEGEGCGNITMHELVTRKLNYSRAQLDACGTRPEHLDDVAEGEREGKMPLFGPIVEERSLSRQTKTSKEGVMVNTNDFNWFCCSEAEDKGE